MELFDWEYYLENNTDLKKNNILTKEAVLTHWEQYGKIEKRIHRFNTDDFSILKLYLKNLIESENKGELSKIDAWDILTNIFNKKNILDQKDDHTISLENFDWKYYISNNIDLINNKILNRELAYEHWIENGKFESKNYRIIKNITFENFDWKYYIIHNLDLLQNNIVSKEKLWNHWINYGKDENRKVNTIDCVSNDSVDCVSNDLNNVRVDNNIINNNQKKYYNISNKNDFNKEINDIDNINIIYNDNSVKDELNLININSNIDKNDMDKIIIDNINIDIDINNINTNDINIDNINTNDINIDNINTDDINIDEIYKNEVNTGENTLDNYIFNPAIINKYIFNPDLYKNHNNINLL